MIQTIPIDPTSPDQEFAITLEDVPVVLRARWNERASAWYLSIFDESGSPIVQGKRVVVAFPMMQRVSDPRMPPGAFVAVDTELGQTAPGQFDLGARVQLLYITSDSVSGIYGTSLGGITFQ